MKAFIHTNIKTGESLNVTASPFYCCDGLSEKWVVQEKVLARICIMKCT